MQSYAYLLQNERYDQVSCQSKPSLLPGDHHREPFVKIDIRDYTSSKSIWKQQSNRGIKQITQDITVKQGYQTNHTGHNSQTGVSNKSHRT
jgi:hypothetical protein